MRSAVEGPLSPGGGEGGGWPECERSPLDRGVRPAASAREKLEVLRLRSVPPSPARNSAQDDGGPLPRRRRVEPDEVGPLSIASFGINNTTIVHTVFSHAVEKKSTAFLPSVNHWLPRILLVPKLRLGNALVPEALLRRHGRGSDRERSPRGRSRASKTRALPSWSLGTRGSPATSPSPKSPPNAAPSPPSPRDQAPAWSRHCLGSSASQGGLWNETLPLDPRRRSGASQTTALPNRSLGARKESARRRNSGERTRPACWRSRPYFANFRTCRNAGGARHHSTRRRKVRRGGTPRPARGTRALPGV